MDKLSLYLQQHIYGETLAGTQVINVFSHDSSLLSFKPKVVVYPKQSNDVRKVVRFVHQLALKGKRLGITTRGSGSSYTGAAIGEDIVMNMAAHFKQINEIDLKKNTITVQPGVNLGRIHQALITHGKWIPAMPQTSEYSTIGGALANDSSGIYSCKYGSISEYVSSVDVVLSNGDLATIGKLSKREYQKMLGQSGLLGDIYRAVDKLIEENEQLIYSTNRLPRSTSYTGLADVKGKDGSMNLIPVIAGSQGILGIVTSITLDIVDYNPDIAMAILAYEDKQIALADCIKIISDKKNTPSSYEFLDSSTIDYVRLVAPKLLEKYIGNINPAMIVVLQNDDPNSRNRASWLKKLEKLSTKSHSTLLLSTQDHEEIEKYKGLLDITAFAVSGEIYQQSGVVSPTPKIAVPVIESAVVPVVNVVELIDRVSHALADRSVCIWGSMSDGVVRVWPKLDISTLSDRQFALKLRSEYATLVSGLGGDIGGPNNIGRWHAQAKKQTDQQWYDLELAVKKIFDAQGIFNPGVRLLDNSSIDDLAQHIRADSYNQKAFARHLPR